MTSQFQCALPCSLSWIVTHCIQIVPILEWFGAGDWLWGRVLQGRLSFSNSKFHFSGATYCLAASPPPPYRNRDSSCVSWNTKLKVLFNPDSGSPTHQATLTRCVWVVDAFPPAPATSGKSLQVCKLQLQNLDRE